MCDLAGSDQPKGAGEEFRTAYYEMLALRDVPRLANGAVINKSPLRRKMVLSKHTETGFAIVVPNAGAAPGYGAFLV